MTYLDIEEGGSSREGRRDQRPPRRLVDVRPPSWRTRFLRWSNRAPRAHCPRGVLAPTLQAEPAGPGRDVSDPRVHLHLRGGAGVGGEADIGYGGVPPSQTQGPSVLLKSVVEIATRPMSQEPAELGPDRSGISVMAVCCDPVRGDAGHRFGGSKECLGGSQIAVLAQHDIDQGSRHQRPMSTDAGTEEHRVSGTLLPMPRRIAQLPSLPVPDAPTCSCCHAALAARAEDRDCPPYSGNP